MFFQGGQNQVVDLLISLKFHEIPILDDKHLEIGPGVEPLLSSSSRSRLHVFPCVFLWVFFLHCCSCFPSFPHKKRWTFPGFFVQLYRMAEVPPDASPRPAAPACGHVAVNMQVCRSAQGTWMKSILREEYEVDDVLMCPAVYGYVSQCI